MGLMRRRRMLEQPTSVSKSTASTQYLRRPQPTPNLPLLLAKQGQVEGVWRRWNLWASYERRVGLFGNHTKTRPTYGPRTQPNISPEIRSRKLREPSAREHGGKVATGPSCFKLVAHQMAMQCAPRVRTKLLARSSKDLTQYQQHLTFKAPRSPWTGESWARGKALRLYSMRTGLQLLQNWRGPPKQVDSCYCLVSCQNGARVAYHPGKL